jgi:hypothetical protein
VERHDRPRRQRGPRRRRHFRPDLGPSLPAQVEAALAARDAPDRYLARSR